jgi:TonB family protein
MVATIAAAPALFAAAPVGAQQGSVQSEFDAASAALVAEKWSRALAILDRLEARLGPGASAKSLAVVRARKGQALIHLEREVEAEQVLRQAIDKLPANDASVVEDRALTLISLGEIAERSREFEEAMTRFRAADALPAVPALKIRILRGLIASGVEVDPEQALRDTDRALALIRTTSPATPASMQRSSRGPKTLDVQFQGFRDAVLTRLGRFDEGSRQRRAINEWIYSTPYDDDVLPKDIPTALVPAELYDKQALRQRQEGDVRVRFDLAGDGTVTNCRVSRPSGKPLLDALACAYLTARSPLSPAVLGDSRELMIRWRYNRLGLPMAMPSGGATRLQRQGLFTSDDYPADAIRRGEDGATLVEIGVSDGGDVQNCRTLMSSGSPSLDRRTCLIASKRLRFLPKVTADGLRVPTREPYRIRWILPG